jgi:hypothetical protein
MLFEGWGVKSNDVASRGTSLFVLAYHRVSRTLLQSDHLPLALRFAQAKAAFSSSLSTPMNLHNFHWNVRFVSKFLLNRLSFNKFWTRMNQMLHWY